VGRRRCKLHPAPLESKAGRPRADSLLHWARPACCQARTVTGLQRRTEASLPGPPPPGSEYIPEIVAYVQQIVANGMAYEACGSVYFDTQAFK
jgi:hypothetical protein